MFLDALKGVDPGEFFQGNNDIIKDVENAIIDERLENIPRPSKGYEDDGDFKWDNPYDQLCWDIKRLLFPRRGKRVR